MIHAKLVVVVVNVDQRVVGHRNHTLARITVDAAERANLTHVDFLQSRQLEKCTVGGFIETLVAANEASVETPLATPWVQMSATDQDLQLVIVEAEDDTVDRQQDLLEFFIICSHCVLNRLPQCNIQNGQDKDNTEGTDVEYLVSSEDVQVDSDTLRIL